jgi:aromatic ring-opening dioxygenase catalytic subunit (LigB family)
MKRRDFTSLLTMSTLGFSMSPLQHLSNWGSSLQKTDLTPALFIGHGSPMNAIEENQFELATLLQKLRQRGVLIIGSGNIVHNLRAVDFSKINTVGYGYDWAHESRAFVNEKIQARQFNALFNLETAPKALQLAVPSTDHFIPLLYTLGLCGASEEIQIFNDELLAGSLSMTSLRIG